MYLVSLGSILLIRDRDRDYAASMARAYADVTGDPVLMVGEGECRKFQCVNGDVLEEPCIARK